MEQKYYNEVLKEKLFDLINGNGAEDVLSALAEHTIISLHKFDLTNIERKRVFDSHINILKNNYFGKLDNFNY